MFQGCERFVQKDVGVLCPPQVMLEDDAEVALFSGNGQYMVTNRNLNDFRSSSCIFLRK